MKKVCVFLMFMLSVYGIFPAYATTDIAADAESSECTENVTGTYSGDANFKAKWTPNTVPLRWYNNHTLMQGVNTESNTCNYGGTLTIPTTPPERIGYIFDGWKVRPTYDFSTLNTVDRTTGRWSISGRGGCEYKDSIVSCDSYAEFGELKQKEWKMHYSWGDVYGSSYCSAKSGDNNNLYYNNASSNWRTTYDELERASGEKKYCWCQATGYKPIGENTIYGQKSVLSGSTWVYASEQRSSYWCNAYCAGLCSSYVSRFDLSGFIRALFGVTQ